MRLCWVITVLMLFVGFSSAETLVTKAKVAAVSERGFILTVGTEALPVQDESATNFWKGRTPANREAFAVGENVTVRLKTDGAPTLVREMMDNDTAEWLDAIRKNPQWGTVTKVDLKSVSMKLDIGGDFTYRYSDKSKLTLGGAVASVPDLKEGQRLSVRGRLLPTLDTWIIEASDQKVAGSASSKPSTSVSNIKPLKIGPSGKIKGIVDLHQPQFWMIDMVVEGRLIHVVYTSKTQFRLDGTKATVQDIQRGLTITATYLRDLYGRLICSKIELSHSSTA